MSTFAKETFTNSLPAGANPFRRLVQRTSKEEIPRLRHRLLACVAILNAVLLLLCSSPARSAETLAEGIHSPGHLSTTESKPAPQRIAKRLLAAWSFDELSGVTCHDVSGHGNEASVDPRTAPAVRHVPGLFGNALSFSQNHAVCLRGDLHLEGIEKISFSAWVAPTELSSYREIFRKEDGEDRVLFSFQNDGAHLSLGLNVGGYVECRAPIKSASSP